MEERIFNCYAIIDGDVIQEVAIAEYTACGSDDEKEIFLRENAVKGYRDAEFYPLPENFILTDMFTDEYLNAIPWIFYRKMLGTSEEIMIFEKAFQALEAPLEPIINISVVINGRVFTAETARECEA
jgi:hypothetical protein